MHVRVSLLVQLVVVCICGWRCGAVQELPGRPLLLVDLNFDQVTDVLVQKDSSSVAAYIAARDRVEFTTVDGEWSVSIAESGAEIANAVAADFDADSRLDLALSYTTKEHPKVFKFQVFWGAVNRKFEAGSNATIFEFGADPSVLDCNMDGLQDVVGVVANGSLVCHSLYKQTNRTWVSQSFLQRPNQNRTFDLTNQELGILFFSLDKNLMPEIMLRIDELTSKDKLSHFEVWEWHSGRKKWDYKEEAVDPIRPAEDSKLFDVNGDDRYHLGPSTIADFNGDGFMDHLIPFCVGEKCAGGADTEGVFLCTHGRWVHHYLNLTEPPSSFHAERQWKLAGDMKLRPGDENLDGFPDLMGILALDDKVVRPFMIKNVPCDKDSIIRCFQVAWSKPNLTDLSNPQRAGFIDLRDDGSLDVFVEHTGASSSKYADKPVTSLISLRHGNSEVAGYFLKSQVYTGTCYGGRARCKSGLEASGVPMIGAGLSYSGRDANGAWRYSASSHWPVTSGRPLELSFALFGLGEAPNFIEHLSVGVPYHSSPNHSWPQLVPNTRLYIVPQPLDSPGSWEGRLFVTPSRLILLSFAALSCVCGVILFVVVILHIRERQVDKRERLLQAHKFHFDAM